MTKAEQIILNRIHELNNRMDWEINIQLKAEYENDTGFDKDLSDRYWHELFERKCELMSVLAEIRGCTINDLTLQ